MRGRTARLGCWVALAGLVAWSACGSTLSSGEQARLKANAVGRTGAAATGADSGEGSIATGDVVSGATEALSDGGAGVAGTAATQRGGTASSGGSAGGSGIAAGTSPTRGQSAGDAVGESAPGVTDTEIKIGLAYDRSAGTTNAALGFGGLIGQIDTRRAYEALIAEVNRTGAVGGRKLKPVYHVLDQTNGKTAEVNAQEMCATFTQDNKVFAVLISGNDTLRSCLTKAGVVQVAGGTGLSDAKTFADFPYLVEVGRPALDRMVNFAVDSHKNAGFYDTGRDGPVPVFRLGVMMYDDPVFQRALAALRAALQAKGIAIFDAVAIKRAPNQAGVADETAAIRAAALKFREQNITHVHFLATNNAFQQLVFMQSAEKQLYRPRYGLTSNDGGQALATLLQSDAAAQLKSSLSVGWFPLFDVPAGDYSGDKLLPAFKRCKKILQDAGETFGDGDPTRNKEAQASIICDPFLYFQLAGKLAGRQLTKETFLRGVAQLGQMESAQTFIMKTTAERRDAMGGYKDAKFFDDCTCFHYTSDVREV